MNDSVRTVLCFGDSNTWGCVPMTAMVDNPDRFGPDTRWPCVLQAKLGTGWRVVEEGLNGRTTVLEDPIEGTHKCGLTYLLPCLESHRPIDIVAIMLGTNDLKARFHLPAEDIAAGAARLVDLVRSTSCGRAGSAPKVLLIAPAPIARLDLFAAMWGETGQRQSQRLAPLYKAAAAARGIRFFDAGTVAAASDIDGVHLDAASQRALGDAVARLLLRDSAPASSADRRSRTPAVKKPRSKAAFED